VFAVLLALAAAGCGKSIPTTPMAMPPVSAVHFVVSADTLQSGQIKLFTATALDTLGAVIANAVFDWRSGDPAVFTVNNNGAVRAVSEGRAKLFAAAGGHSDSMMISVFVNRGWYTQASFTSTDLNGVYFLPDGRHGWAVGSAGRILATGDAGASWAPQVSHNMFTLNAVWFTGPDSGWVVGGAGTILHTVNGGLTWTQIASNASENLLDVCFATRDTGWVVGAGGVVLRTFDRGASWQRQTPTLSDLQSVSFAGTRDGWAVGSGGVIIGTHDRGLSWYVVQPAVTGLSLNAVWRRSSWLGWAAGQSGAMPRTVSLPDTAWTLGNAGASNSLLGVCYPADAIGYAVGYNSGGTGVVLRTDDGGLSWQTQTPGTQFRLKDVFFIDAQNGWAVGRGGVILHTSSGGLP
jgi:photosystem II stability/assembly factor-like uncharacterized protein